jgi:hypothetical protein
MTAHDVADRLPDRQRVGVGRTDDHAGAMAQADLVGTGRGHDGVDPGHADGRKRADPDRRLGFGFVMNQLGNDGAAHLLAATYGSLEQ